MPARILRRLATASLMITVAAGCSADAVLDVPAVSPDSLASLESNEPGADRAFLVLPLETPDGFDQTVHPDYAMMPGWSPRRFMVATPYAFSDTLLENPSLYSQDPQFNWLLHGPSNPIAKPRAGYLSDPDIVALHDRKELWVYYREVTRRNTIWLIRSPDGLSWSSPDRVVSAPRHMIVSPSVVRLGPEDWMMWSVNAGKEGCNGSSSFVEVRRSTDGIAWTPPTAVSLAQEPFIIWHIEVQWIPSRQEFWALYNVKRKGNCNTDLLFMATSADGLTWTTYPSPVLRAGAIPEFNEIVYRSAFAYNSRTDNIRFWFSGASWKGRGYIWRTVYQRRKRADVFAAISKEPIEPLSARRGRDVPALVNPP
jgi:hypothetical protein